MKRTVIKLSEWARGHYIGVRHLVGNTDGNCCLGFDGLQHSSFSADELHQCVYPSAVQLSGSWQNEWQRPCPADIAQRIPGGELPESMTLQHAASYWNDMRPEISETERIARLTEVFAAAGRELVIEP